MKSLLWFPPLSIVLFMPTLVLASTHAEMFASCTVCHPTEIASTSPAWNRGATPVVYTAYRMTAPAASHASALCLSCHATTAPDSHRSSESWLVGGAIRDDRRGDHPIGVDFEHARDLRGGLRSSWAPSGLGGSVVDDLLALGRVECTSCHDMHSAQDAPFLVTSNAGSALCLACHEK